MFAFVGGAGNTEWLFVQGEGGETAQNAVCTQGGESSEMVSSVETKERLKTQKNLTPYQIYFR